MPPPGIRLRSSSASVAYALSAASHSAARNARTIPRTTSTFSSDIAHAVSRDERCFPCGAPLLVRSSGFDLLPRFRQIRRAGLERYEVSCEINDRRRTRRSYLVMAGGPAVD